MAKIMQNAIDQTRSYLDESSAADWTSPEVNREVNAGYQRIITAVLETFENYYVTSYTAASVNGQQEYALPTDFLKMRRVEVNYEPNTTGSVRQRAYPMDIDQVRRDLAVTTLGPSILRNPGYYIVGNNIGFIPIPTVSSTGTDAIKIWYVQYQSDLSATTDVINIPYPDRFYSSIAKYAAAQLLRKGQQEELAARQLMDEFNNDLLEMKRQLEDRIEEETKSVIDVHGDGFGLFGEGIPG